MLDDGVLISWEAKEKVILYNIQPSFPQKGKLESRISGKKVMTIASLKGNRV